MYDYLTAAQKPVLGDVVGGDRGESDCGPATLEGAFGALWHRSYRGSSAHVVGDRDYGVRSSLAEEYYRLAKEKGKPTEYVLYNNEPHGWYHWRPESLRDSLERIAAHYEKHVGQ